MKPIVKRNTKPVRLIDDAVIDEFVGHDSDLDLSQDRLWPILYRAAIEQGEHSTGAVWAEAEYTIDRLPLTAYGRYGNGNIVMPISPVFTVTALFAVDHEGAETELPKETWSCIPACLETYRPWAVIHALGSPFPCASWFRAKVMAGWSPDEFPDSLKGWALVRMATLYDYREDIANGGLHSNMPRDHVVGMLDRWRVYGNPYGQE